MVSDNLVFNKNRFSVTIGRKTGTVLPFKAQVTSVYLFLVVSTKLVLKPKLTNCVIFVPT